MTRDVVRYLSALLVLMAGVAVVAACGSSGPELPDTSSESLIAYLEEVDYQENWELWPGLSEKYPASLMGCS